MKEELTDAQWALLAPLLPPPKQRGRKHADDRATLNGILFVLQTGCRWKDIPPRYGAPTTCWERGWRTLLGTLEGQGKIKWAKAFLDRSFVPAKGGRGRRADTQGQENQVDASHRWAGSPSGTPVG